MKESEDVGRAGARVGKGGARPQAELRFVVVKREGADEQLISYTVITKCYST